MKEQRGWDKNGSSEDGEKRTEQKYLGDKAVGFDDRWNVGSTERDMSEFLVSGLHNHGDGGCSWGEGDLGGAVPEERRLRCLWDVWEEMLSEQGSWRIQSADGKFCVICIAVEIRAERGLEWQQGLDCPDNRRAGVTGQNRCDEDEVGWAGVSTVCSEGQ